MHILFLTDNFPPEVNAPASRTFEHCREWVRAGERVTVITCAPNFPRGKVFGGYRNRLWQSEMIDGVRVIRVWSYITANEGFARRIADYVSYAVAATLAAPFVRKADIVIGTSPQFFTACAAYATSRLKRVPFVFELRDIWPESIRAVGAMKQSRVLDWLETLELFLYRKAALVVSVTNSFRDNLASRGIDPGKVKVITNGVDVSRFKPLAKDAALSRELGFDGKFVAGYIGTHGMAHALETILDAAEHLRSQPGGDVYRFLLLGDGARKQELKADAARRGLDNVVFVDSVSKDDVVRYWSLLDASIIHLKKSDLFTTVIPSKLFECMGMGIPVLMGVEGESAGIVERTEVGLLFEPENADALCAALTRLAADQDLRLRLSANGQTAAISYDRSTLAMEMLAQLRLLAMPAGRTGSN
ncbi:MAG: glycosyltransferase family 4 protein [Rhizobiaceae bacterium]